MATYTDFTSQARHMICYSFVCQHCGENSGPIYHEFQGVAKKRKSGVVKYLKDDEKENLDRNARRELELNINEAKQQVSENVYSHLYFNGKCPRCGKNQNWSGGKFGSYVFIEALKWMLYSSILVAIVFFFMAGPKSWDWNEAITNFVIVMAGIFGLAALVRLVKWLMIRKDHGKGKDASYPEINWND